jgi:hypothetical protein
MKLIIAGSRTLTRYEWLVDAILQSGFKPREIVSGGARGPDKLGERYAAEMGIQVKLFPAQWDKFGKSAGYRRNAEMGDYADALLILYDGVSKGSKHMFEYMHKIRKYNVFVYDVSSQTVTSYSARYKEGIWTPLSIAQGSPNWYTGAEYDALKPPWDLITRYKRDGNAALYTAGYYTQVLNRLDRDEVRKHVRGHALLCWERAGEFCHRRIVAEWLGGCVTEVS